MNMSATKLADQCPQISAKVLQVQRVPLELIQFEGSRVVLYLKCLHPRAAPGV